MTTKIVYPTVEYEKILTTTLVDSRKTYFVNKTLTYQDGYVEKNHCTAEVAKDGTNSFVSAGKDDDVRHPLGLFYCWSQEEVKKLTGLSMSEQNKTLCLRWSCFSLLEKDSFANKYKGKY